MFSAIVILNKLQGVSSTQGPTFLNTTDMVS